MKNNTMEYFKFGRGDEVLVLIPGISPDSVMKYADAVADAYEPFADEYTVYLFDRRKDMPETYTICDMARDTVETMENLGIEKAVIMGTSQGGMIAMDIGISCPQLTKALVICSSCGDVNPERFRVFEKLEKMAKAGNAEELYLAFGELVYPPEVFEVSKEAIKQVAAAVTEEELRRFVIVTEGMRNYYALDDLQKIQCPTLVIGSESDRIFPKEASPEIAAKLPKGPGTVLHMYEGYGHTAYDFAPDYKERVLNFLKENAAR